MIIFLHTNAFIILYSVLHKILVWNVVGHIYRSNFGDTNYANFVKSMIMNFRLKQICHSTLIDFFLIFRSIVYCAFTIVKYAKGKKNIKKSPGIGYIFSSIWCKKKRKQYVYRFNSYRVFHNGKWLCNDGSFTYKIWTKLQEVDYKHNYFSEIQMMSIITT